MCARGIERMEMRLDRVFIVLCT